jgi:hypothetical protein
MTPDLESENGWSIVAIVFHGVSEVCLRESSSSAQILNCGVTLMEHDGGVFADFHEEDSAVRSARLHSGFYVLADSAAVSSIAPAPSADDNMS